MNHRIQRNYNSINRDQNIGYKSVSFRANPGEIKKIEEIQEILPELHLNSSFTNAFRVVFHYFNTAEYKEEFRNRL